MRRGEQDLRDWNLARCQDGLARHVALAAFLVAQGANIDRIAGALGCSRHKANRAVEKAAQPKHVETIKRGLRLLIADAEAAGERSQSEGVL